MHPIVRRTTLSPHPSLPAGRSGAGGASRATRGDPERIRSALRVVHQQYRGNVDGGGQGGDEEGEEEGGEEDRGNGEHVELDLEAGEDMETEEGGNAVTATADPTAVEDGGHQGGEGISEGKEGTAAADAEGGSNEGGKEAAAGSKEAEAGGGKSREGASSGMVTAASVASAAGDDTLKNTAEGEDDAKVQESIDGEDQPSGAAIPSLPSLNHAAPEESIGAATIIDKLPVRVSVEASKPPIIPPPHAVTPPHPGGSNPILAMIYDGLDAGAYDASEELDRYTADPPMKAGHDVLQWWKDHEARYPGLAAMARDYLAIPGLGRGAEEQFLRVKEAVVQVDSAVSSDVVCALTCLATWQ